MEAFREGHSAGDAEKNFQGSRDKIMKYEYPAVISYDFRDKIYYVDFPGMSNCFTDGETLREALDNAEDVLNLMLLDAETRGLEVPKPVRIEDIKLEAGQITALVKADTDLYSKVAV